MGLGIDPFPIFRETNKLISKVVMQICTPISSGRVFCLLHSPRQAIISIFILAKECMFYLSTISLCHFVRRICHHKKRKNKHRLLQSFEIKHSLQYQFSCVQQACLHTVEHPLHSSLVCWGRHLPTSLHSPPGT